MGNVENVNMVKEALKESIKEVCKEKEKYSIGENAFIRNRELPLPKLIEDILLFENKSIEKSLLGNHQFSKTTPTAAAFVRQRNKLKPESFEHIFHSMRKLLVCVQKLLNDTGCLQETELKKPIFGNTEKKVSICCM